MRSCRKALAALALALLLQPGVLHAQQGGPEDTAREFLRALLTVDRAAFDRITEPLPASRRLLPADRPTRDERRGIDAGIGEVRFERIQEFRFEGRSMVPRTDGRLPVGTTTRYLAEFRGAFWFLPVVRRKSGWKVDTRWMLAAQPNTRRVPVPGSPEETVRIFLARLLANDRSAVAMTVGGPDTLLLFQDAAAPTEPTEYYTILSEEMPLVTAARGEFYPTPSGSLLEGGGADPDTRLLVGLLGGVEIPFLLRRVDGEWKILPQRYFNYLNQ